MIKRALITHHTPITHYMSSAACFAERYDKIPKKSKQTQLIIQNNGILTTKVDKNKVDDKLITNKNKGKE